ncbi:MAG: succinyl-diaminopimelate desuccinylase, partial [Thermoprotei archaeon]
PRGAKATINIGGEVKGGAKVNIVPGYFSFSIDRRTIPEESADEAAKEIVEFINNIAKEIPDLKVNVKVMSKFNATVSEPTTELVRTAVKSAEEVLGYKPSTTVCIGGLDTRYFQEKGVRAITYGPGVPSTAHMADEYIKIDDMVKMAKIYARIITRLL